MRHRWLILFLTAGCATAAPEIPQASHGDGVLLSDAARQWVRVAEVEPSPVLNKVLAPGRVEVRVDADLRISAPAPGRVATVHVREGMRVAAGDLLVSIHSAEAAQKRGDLRALRVSLEAARAELARQDRLLASGVGLEVERLRAEAEVRRAEAAIGAAWHETSLLGDGAGSAIELRAPRDGTVVDLLVRPGLAVSPDSGPLVAVSSTDALQVRLEVYEDDLRRITIGQPVSLQAGDGDVPVVGHVIEVADAAEPVRRRGPVLVDVPELPPGWVPGTLVQGGIAAGAAAPLGVPATSVVIRPDNTRVVYVEDPEGRLVQRPVEVGRVTDGVAPIVAGLTAGERVVVDGALLIDAYADSLL